MITDGLKNSKNIIMKKALLFISGFITGIVATILVAILCARQIGTYRYTTKNEMVKTVPAVVIE